MDNFNDEAIKWPSFIIYVYMFTWSWLRHGFVLFMVILRSTMGPYRRPMTEVAYEEMLLSLHRGCMGVDSSERVVGVSTWCRPCWTYPGQHQCGLNVFFGFQYIKSMYMYNVFIIYIWSTKEHWWCYVVLRAPMIDLCRGRIWGDVTFTPPKLYGSW